MRVAPARLPVSDTGFTTYFFHDALGRQTATVDALGPDWPVTALPDALPTTVTTNVTRIVYDARGRVAAFTDALGQPITSPMAPGEIVQTPVPNAFPNPSGGRAVGDNIPRGRYPATTPACLVWQIDVR